MLTPGRMRSFPSKARSRRWVGRSSRCVPHTSRSTRSRRTKQRLAGIDRLAMMLRWLPVQRLGSASQAARIDRIPTDLAPQLAGSGVRLVQRRQTAAEPESSQPRYRSRETGPACGYGVVRVASRQRFR